MSDDDGLKLVAIRELTAGDYGPIYKVGQQVPCPCERTDRDVASLELEEGNGGAIIHYTDGSKLLFRAPFVALYQNPVSLKALEAPPEPALDEVVPTEEAVADETNTFTPSEGAVEDPADIAPEGFGAELGRITGPVGAAGDARSL